jgi:hypothetical protein
LRVHQLVGSSKLIGAVGANQPPGALIRRADKIKASARNPAVNIRPSRYVARVSSTYNTVAADDGVFEDDRSAANAHNAAALGRAIRLTALSSRAVITAHGATEE